MSSKLLPGKYMQDRSQKPYIMADLKINNGSLSYKKLKDPLKNINIDFKSVIYNLNKSELEIDLKNLSFDLAGNKTQMHFYSKGYQKMQLKTEIQANLDLDRLTQTLNLQKNIFKGQLDLDLVANGTYAKGIRIQKNKIDTVITSIPKFTLNGTFKKRVF
ncbi:hypothetical protein K5I29_07615 [Flavobacterium agricola]|uniref:AsmA-like C-terminal domain-containing protein n=1 Tax=Flavobacterium agricola TaxID=2870839 RepID=A0ABY6LVS0_9FLAO|nr:hypothetical protein [Flavobacterium agricola]UYW00427.1 hypothetical protein K5I29_07615 [Flavobacterium agricola]